MELPRLALGTIQPDAKADFLCWALLEALKRQGCQVQHFASRCCFTRLNGALTAAGVSSRHLDSWLMTPEMCRELLVRGTADSEMALVEGCYDAARESVGSGGSLDQLCHSLDLPRLAAIDVSQLRQCRLPPRPAAAGLLLDCVADAADLYHWQTHLEALWGIPVLGALDELPRLRGAVAALHPGATVPHDLVQALGNAFERFAQCGAIRRLAASRPLGESRCELFGPPQTLRRLSIAVAYDEAFNCYFPDTIDLLELMGATLIDFSPLHDEQLPAGADLVYIGCGHPERYASELAENCCMTSALRKHFCEGKRIYADGGGLAYLCQSIATLDGRTWPMVGALPAVARLNPQAEPFQPVELTLARPSWLGEIGARVRGYRNSRWLLEPAGPLSGLIAEPGHERDLVVCFRAVASCLQINLATQPGFLRTFFEPLAPIHGLRSAAIAVR
ncbi:MAG TPA: hypothetical protein VHY20_05715 [Pirellulales bacterium]|nr:hypothetical protein [Pirellulales bacterium]